MLPEPEYDEKQYYKPVRWKGVLDTFKCIGCDLCLESEDDMILHVITHVPPADRETLLQELIDNKEKKNGKNIDHSTGN